MQTYGILGELLRQRLYFPAEVVVYASPYNPGAREFQAELQEVYPAIKSADRLGVPTEMAAVGEPSPSQPPSQPTHFMLYLSHETFVGEQGELLAKEVRAAVEAKVPLFMPHENDPAKGGCQFEVCATLSLRCDCPSCLFEVCVTLSLRCDCPNEVIQ